jgi:hypothetical protein
VEQFNENIELFDPRNPYLGDDKLPVEFYMGTVAAPEEQSAKAGHPVFLDVECIKIYNSKDNVIDRPVRDTDKARWPRKYAAWKATGVSTPGGGGWPLEQWPQITRGQAEEFKYFKIYTVEQLANMPDSLGVNIMGFNQLKVKGEAPLLQMQAALESRDAKIAELEVEIRRISDMLREFTGKKAA